MTDPTTDNPVCLCGQTGPYMSCCGRFLETGAYPRDPASLMRSRYCAYVLQRRAYLTKTWHPSTCPDLTDHHLSGTQWQRLDVLRSHAGFKKGWVEFIAHFIDEAAQPGQLHEVSEFHKVKNRWVYYAECEAWPAV